MATSREHPTSESLAFSYFETALCIILPQHLCLEIDALRATYDQAYGRWPAHINLLYPFVAAGSVSEAASLIAAKLTALQENSQALNVRVRIAEASHFSPKKGNLIHLVPRSVGGATTLEELRSVVVDALGQKDDLEYNPHLTVGQTRAGDCQSRDSLLSKARLLSPIEWAVTELVVLVRERIVSDGHKSKKMRIGATIDLSGKVTLYQDHAIRDGPTYIMHGMETFQTGEVGAAAIQSMTTYRYPLDGHAWDRHLPSTEDTNEKEPNPDFLTISSFNVLLDDPYPPPRERYSTLVRNILSQSALADVLTLQEVYDDFLSHLLSQDEVRNRYPFCTYGPPYQAGCGPLPLQRNIVVLSRFEFTWKNLPFSERYKNAAIIELTHVGARRQDADLLPLVIAAVHLTSGISDTAVAAKKSQIQLLFEFLNQKYPQNPCVLAGDTNIPTSEVTLKKAVEQKLLSSEKATVLSQLDLQISNSRFRDAWVIARATARDLSAKFNSSMALHDAFDGEQGATFDPSQNPLAAVSAGQDGRPQRYDRILVDQTDFLQTYEFNLFGFPSDADSHDFDSEIESPIGSDHWGIRATFKIQPENEGSQEYHDSILPSFDLSPELDDRSALKSCLLENSMLPTQEERHKRRAALDSLRNILVQGSNDPVNYEPNNNEPKISLVLTPVGSYGLGVWNSCSDIDCLCIGSISSKTFFTIAEQRIRKAANLGVRVIRKVKAASGTMLELEIDDIKCDLQYCPAAKVVDEWKRLSLLLPNDPIFDLSAQALTKLQAFRDLDYIQRTIPDLAAFRNAHRFLTAWAKSRGIYLSRFGYLGGIHITMMLSRICKLSSRSGMVVTSMKLICMFFKYYSDFDWEHETVFDPTFFNIAPRYRRYPIEPMVILTIHTPVVNVARAATAASAETIFQELRRMNQLLLEPDVTWSSLIGGTNTTLRPYQEFLRAYKSYIKIQVQYWGLSLAKGSTLLGWLESRSIRLLNSIDKRLPSIHARLWPARFTSTETVPRDTEYAGCYLIGLSRKDLGEAENSTKEERKENLELLSRLLGRFESQLQEETQYFDPKTAWLNVTHVKQDEVVDLNIDNREWGSYIAAEEVSESEDDDDEGVDECAEEKAIAAAAQRTARKQKGATGVPSVKLRPASDILNRLRWDPNIDPGDYVVGYDDRFLGSMEIPLDNWKTEQTDDQFIPQHRIIYFKRKADGVVVWDRESKKDLVFGSGIVEGP